MKFGLNKDTKSIIGLISTWGIIAITEYDIITKLVKHEKLMDKL